MLKFTLLHIAQHGIVSKLGKYQGLPWIDGKEYRENGPSHTVWYKNGQKRYEGCCTNGIYQNSKYWNEQGKPL